MAEAGRETGPGVPLDVQLAQLAASQHGVFSLPQLVAIGLTASGVRKRVAAGRLHRVHHAVYALVPAPLVSVKGRYVAAVLACGPGAVLSHRSAADLHDLRATSRRNIDVIVPGRTSHRHDGVDVHRSLTLLPGVDVTEIDGIPCTTIARTLLDLAGVVTMPQLERALNQAEAMNVLNLRTLQDQIERNRTTPAAAKLRQALAFYEPGQAPTESGLEEDLLTHLRAADLPLPERQVHIPLDDGEEPIRADFVWRAQRLVLETDGRQFHATARAFETDRRRDQRLARAGWRVVRVTWRQLRDDPAAVVRMLADLLRQTDLIR